MKSKKLSLLERIKQAEKEFAEGRGIDWRLVRSDIDELVQQPRRKAGRTKKTKK